MKKNEDGVMKEIENGVEWIRWCNEEDGVMEIEGSVMIEIEDVVMV